MSRDFHHLLFAGAGDLPVIRYYLLKRKFKNAINISSGLQQEMSVCIPEYQAATREVEDTVRDIAAALLGREIEFGAEIPYPTSED